MGWGLASFEAQPMKSRADFEERLKYGASVHPSNLVCSIFDSGTEALEDWANAQKMLQIFSTE
jgi:hypothetical protein